MYLNFAKKGHKQGKKTNTKIIQNTEKGKKCENNIYVLKKPKKKRKGKKIVK